MDADIELTGETRPTNRGWQTLVIVNSLKYWLSTWPTHTLHALVKFRLTLPDGWIGRESLVTEFHTFDTSEIDRRIYTLRETFGPAIVECARRKKLFRLGIEKDRITLDPALSEHPDYRVRSLFLDQAPCCAPCTPEEPPDIPLGPDDPV